MILERMRGANNTAVIKHRILLRQSTCYNPSNKPHKKKLIYVTTVVRGVSDFKNNNPNLLIINKRYNIADLFGCHRKIKKYMFFLFLLEKN
jgi:hypothetical protein